MRGARIAAASALLCGCFVVIDFDDLDPSRPPIFDEAGAPPPPPAPTVAPAAPGFTLSVTPELVLDVRGEGAVTVTAERVPGFDGAITLAAKDPPAGFTIGTARIEAGTSSAAVSVAAPASPVPPQTITIVGTSGNATATASFSVTVLPPAGTLDDTFGQGGILRTLAPLPIFYAAIGQDGRCTAVNDLCIFRFLLDGGADPAYGDGGTARIDVAFNPSGGDIGSPSFEENGAVHVVGYDPAASPKSTRLRVARVSSDGSVSTATLDGGPFGPAPTVGGAGATDVIATSDGGAGLAVQRLGATGGVDPAFVFDPSPYEQAIFWPRQVHDRGGAGVVVFGEAADANGVPGKELGVIHVLPSGAPKPGFGGRAPGLATFGVDAGSKAACMRAALFDGDRIYVAGFVTTTPCRGNDNHVLLGPQDELRLYRLRAEDGSIDPTFGGPNGLRLPVGTSARPNALALQPDGKLLVAGGVNLTGTPRGMLLRVLSNGTLDPTFTSPTFALGVILGRDNERTELTDVRFIDSRIVAVGRADAGGGSGGPQPFFARFIP